MSSLSTESIIIIVAVIGGFASIAIILYIAYECIYNAPKSKESNKLSSISSGKRRFGGDERQRHLYRSNHETNSDSLSEEFDVESGPNANTAFEDNRRGGENKLAGYYSHTDDENHKRNSKRQPTRSSRREHRESPNNRPLQRKSLSPNPLAQKVSSIPRNDPFAVINDVQSRSPASEAGLRNGDLLIRIGSVSLSSEYQPSLYFSIIPSIIESHKDSTLKVTVLRRLHHQSGTSSQVLQLKLVPSVWEGEGLLGCSLNPLPIVAQTSSSGARLESGPKPIKDPTISTRTMSTLSKFPRQSSGQPISHESSEEPFAVIDLVDNPNSIAYASGLRNGDQLIKFGPLSLILEAQPTKSIPHILRENAGKVIPLVILRGRVVMELQLKMPKSDPKSSSSGQIGCSIVPIRDVDEEDTTSVSFSMMDAALLMESPQMARSGAHSGSRGDGGGLRSTPFAVVRKVIRFSPADKAGIQNGDKVVKFGPLMLNAESTAEDKEALLEEIAFVVKEHIRKSLPVVVLRYDDLRERDVLLPLNLVVPASKLDKRGKKGGLIGCSMELYVD